jgi:DNA polymerase epsilon subunit 2
MRMSSRDWFITSQRSILTGKFVHYERRTNTNNRTRSKSKPSLFPPPSHKTELFRQRYHIVHQRILRNEGFQQQPMTGTTRQTNAFDGSAVNKITPINNLLGRNDSSHLLLGLLMVLPTGSLALSDLTGSIELDIQHARPFPDASSTYFCPGMIVLVDGVYVEDGSGASESSLGTMGGIGATIGGKFLASLIAHPPCEKRSTTLGIQEDAAAVGAAFGWTDFLGLGSDKAIGPRMRSLQSRIFAPEAPHEGNTKIVVAAEVNLDQPTVLAAVRTLFAHYASRPAAQIPLGIVLMGNFISQPALTAVNGSSSIEYKECFNNLAGVISDFPTVLSRTTLVLVPGDQDAWSSAFSAGSATPLPHKSVPELFTTRIRRVVAEANREVRGRQKNGKEGEVVWTSNPSRLTWFGCAGEMVLFRDDISGRFRRSAIRFPKQEDEEDEDTRMDDAEQADPDTLAARRLTKTICDQAHLAPFPLSTRPVLWDYGSTLHLYPLPSALVIADPDAPAFSLKYMGSCVMNPGRLVEGRRGDRVNWLEYDVMTQKGEVKSEG